MSSRIGKLVFSMQLVKPDASLVLFHTMPSRGTTLLTNQMLLNPDPSMCSGLTEDAANRLDLKKADKAK